MLPVNQSHQLPGANCPRPLPPGLQELLLGVHLIRVVWGVGNSQSYKQHRGLHCPGKGLMCLLDRASAATRLVQSVQSRNLAFRTIDLMLFRFSARP